MSEENKYAGKNLMELTDSAKIIIKINQSYCDFTENNNDERPNVCYVGSNTKKALENLFYQFIMGSEAKEKYRGMKIIEVAGHPNHLHVCRMEDQNQ